MRHANSRWLRPAVVFAVSLAGCVLFGCGGRSTIARPPGPAVEAPVATAHGVSLYLLDDPRLDAPQAGRFILDAEPSAGGMELTVRVVGAERLRSCYCRLEYDPAQYAAESAEAGPVWGDADQRLSLAILDQPGLAYFGAVLVHPQEEWGFEGDGVIARVTLGPPQAAATPRAASAVPKSNGCRALLKWDAGTNTLSWFYTVQGDYNQDGEVGINDLTPLGIHFNEKGPFDPTKAAFVCDGDGNSEINIQDVTPIGANFQADALGGYKIYASTDVADYPAANDDASQVAPLAGPPLNPPAGDPAFDRLYFEYQVVAPQPNVYYWVRPCDTDLNAGTPSTMVAGNPADVPVLALTNPPAAGAGTLANPYVISGAEWYDFTVISPSFGDVTNDPSTAYFVSDPRAGSIATSAAILNPAFPFTGDFSIWAAYDNVSTANRIYVRLDPMYDWTTEVVDTFGAVDNFFGFAISAVRIGGDTAISYYDFTNENLKYAQFVTGVWHKMVVEHDGKIGLYPSMMQYNGKAAIAYYDEDNHALKFARATIDVPEQVSDWSIHTVKTPVEVGDISLALIGGRPAIAYHNSGSERIEYARALVDNPASAADWAIHQIEATEICNTPRLHSVNAVPGLAFRAVESNKLIYARGTTAEPNSTADWIMMEVAPANVSSLSFDDEDGFQPVLAYRDHDTDTLNFAVGMMDPADHNDWTTELVVGGHDEGADCSLGAIAGHLSLAYLRLSDSSLQFAVCDTPDPVANDWQHQVVEGASDVGGFCSITHVGPPLSETPGIAYYDVTNNDLRIAWGAENW